MKQFNKFHSKYSHMDNQKKQSQTTVEQIQHKNNTDLIITNIQ